MRKLLLLLLLLLNISPIQASNFSTSLRPSPITIQPNQEFTLNVNVSNVNNLVAIEGNFTYDTSKLQLLDNEFTYNGFDVAIGSRLVVNFKTPRSGSFTAAQVRFRARSTFNVNENTTIRFTSVSGSNGTQDFSANNAETTVTMNPAKSSNSYLSSLNVSSGQLNFSKTVTSYTVDVENSVTSITISGQVEDAKARVSGLGTFNLNVYENPINVVVSAEDGSRRTYSLNVRRKDELGNPVFVSSNTDIDTLTLSACELSFSNLIDDYSCVVRNDVNQSTLEVSTSDPTMTLEYPSSVNLSVGINTIEVKVVAENGNVRIITLVVERSDDVFFVSQEQALKSLENISIPILGINIQEGEVVFADVLTQAFRLNKKLLIQNEVTSILLTPQQVFTEDIQLFFVSISETFYQRFNYAQGQFVGLSEPLPSGVSGAWYIHPSLQSLSLNIYDVNDPSTPLRLASQDGIIEDVDLTQALFITPATLHQANGSWIWLILSGVGGMLIGIGIMLLIRMRKA